MLGRFYVAMSGVRKFNVFLQPWCPSVLVSQCPSNMGRVDEQTVQTGGTNETHGQGGTNKTHKQGERDK